LGKITKKVQKIADQLQRVEGDKKKAADSPAPLEIHTVEPLFKGSSDIPKSKGKIKKSHKKKREGVADVKKDPVREPADKEERLAGYAGFARRITRGFERATGRVKFWFDDD
jgi:hypothetical protein